MSEANSQGFVVFLWLIKSCMFSKAATTVSLFEPQMYFPQRAYMNPQLFLTKDKLRFNLNKSPAHNSSLQSSAAPAVQLYSNNEFFTPFSSTSFYFNCDVRLS